MELRGVCMGGIGIGHAHAGHWGEFRGCRSFDWPDEKFRSREACSLAGLEHDVRKTPARPPFDFAVSCVSECSSLVDAAVGIMVHVHASPCVACVCTMVSAAGTRHPSGRVFSKRVL